MVGRCVAASDEPLGGGDEIVEDVLLLRPLARFMPFLAIFGAAPEVGDREDAAFLHPGHGPRAEFGEQADVEAAVCVQDCGIVSIAPEALAVDEGNRDPGAV